MTKPKTPSDGTRFHNGLGAADGARQARKRLPPEQLKPLTSIDNGRALVSVAITLAATAFSLWLGASAIAGQWWLLPLAVVLIATQQHALFILAHDAAHYRLSSHRGLNDALGAALGGLGGLSMHTYRVTHRLHHNNLYQRNDPDLALMGGYPRGRRYLLRKLLIDLSGVTAPKNLAYFFGTPAINSETGDRINPLNDTAESLRAAARRDRSRVIGLQLALPVLAVATAGWSGLLHYALLWLLPFATVMQALLRLRAIAEHGAPAGTDSPLQAARTNLLRGPLAPLMRLLLFPHHVNYHIEHHLYPAVPHYKLPTLHRALRDHGVLDDAEVRELPDTLRRVFADPRPAH